jgi:hypothetical protein
LDAILKIDSSINSTGYITSLINSGYHRTSRELEQRNNISLTSLGTNLKYSAFGCNIGLNMTHYIFSHSLKASENPYDQFSIQGKKWSNYSFDYSCTWRNLHAFGEIAADKNLNKGLITGLISSLDRSVDLSVIYRNISKRYQSLYGNAFTENTSPTNEKGIYVGLAFRPVPQLKLDAYADIYKFPWLRFRTDAPGYGCEYVFQLTFIRGRQAEIYIRYKKEAKVINQPSGLSTSAVESIPRRHLRYHFTYKFNRELVFKTRVDVTWFHYDPALSETGYLAYIDLYYKHSSKPFSGYTRFQYFETDSYNSRLYSFENDLRFTFNSPVFFDKGFRWYVILRTNVSKWFSIMSSLKIEGELKYSLTHYFNLDKIGAELNEIQGNQRSEFKFQLLISR